MPKRKISPYLIGGAMLILALMLYALFNRPAQPSIPKPSEEEPALSLRMHALSEVPAAVAEAAKALQNSEVGYAMVMDGRTYLIISTGRETVRIAARRVDAKPAAAAPDLVDIHLSSDPNGESLLIASLPLARPARYQFPVDGKYAVIPALHNPHNLPLTDLPRMGGFALVAPQADAMVEGRVLSVAGYARVFEAGFTAHLLADDGRLLKEMVIKSAAGAPDWGSFQAEMDLAGIQLPERGKLILSDALSGTRHEMLLRFRPPVQMG